MSRQLFESLNYKDLEGMMKPTIHVDEFAAKMGEDDDVCVVSFFVRDKNAAKDLMNWFEKGYDWVMDADQSPGEIKSNRYLVYVEMRRRSSLPRQLEEMLDDLGTLTEYSVDDWELHYDGKTYPWSPETFGKLVPLNPRDYRERKERDLNEMRVAAGITVKPTYENDAVMRSIQSAAGIL